MKNNYAGYGGGGISLKGGQSSLKCSGINEFVNNYGIEYGGSLLYQDNFHLSKNVNNKECYLNMQNNTAMYGTGIALLNIVNISGYSFINYSSIDTFGNSNKDKSIYWLWQNTGFDLFNTWPIGHDLNITFFDYNSISLTAMLEIEIIVNDRLGKKIRIKCRQDFFRLNFFVSSNY